MRKLFTTTKRFKAGKSFQPLLSDLLTLSKTARFCVALFVFGLSGLTALGQGSNIPVKIPASPYTTIKTSPLKKYISVRDAKWKGDGLYAKFKPEDEVIEKRDGVSKHFKNKDGSLTAVISQGPAHYQKPGSSVWEDISTDIRPNSTGLYSNYELAIPENRCQLYFSQSIDNGYLLHFSSGDIQCGSNGGIQLLAGDNSVIRSIPRTSSSGQASGNTLKFNNTYPSAYDILKVGNITLEHDVVLTQKPGYLSTANLSTVGFRDFVKLPAGWTLVPYFESTAKGGKGLNVVDASGQVVSKYLPPVIREQNNRQIPRTGSKGNSTEITDIQTTGEFKVEYADGGAYITTCVPASWLNDPDRQYPVVIDPTQNVYPYFSGGWTGFAYNSSSCYCGNNLCGDNIYTQGATGAAGYAYFYTSSINQYSTVSNVVLNYYISSENCPYFYIRAGYNMNNYGSNCGNLWNQMYNGTVYYTDASCSGATWYRPNLGSQGAADLQSNLNQGSFGVCWEDYDGSNSYYAYINGWYYTTGSGPYITVTYVDPAYNTNNGYGVYWGSITPSCISQNTGSTVASTEYIAFYPTAGVTYNFSFSGSGWGTNAMTVYYYNGSAWTPAVNGTNSLTYTPSSGNLAYSSENLISVYNGTGDPPAWITNSGALTYQIATPSTPAISQSSSPVCINANDQFTATGITVGSFSKFIYGYGSLGSSTLSTSNPYSWPASNTTAGTTIYVAAQSINGGCTAQSSTVTSTVNSLSSTGSFGSTLYTCNGGYTYNTSGVLTAQTITGYNGSILGWGYGSSGTCSSDNSSFPTNANNSTSPWTCCFPAGGGTSTLMVEVQNGACGVAQACYTFVPNTMTAPTSASVSPSNVCQGYSGYITLSYSGGGSAYLPATLKWYSGSCGGTYVGSGQNLVLAAPSGNTTYYCAWVDPCGDLTSCASTTFTVTPTPTVSSSNYSLCVNGTATLSSSVGGTWASNNTGVATVSGSTITGVAAGSTTFTFTSTASPNCTATTSTVSVTANPVVSITGSTSFCGGGPTTTLSPTSGGTWASNNTSVATVSGYTVTGTSAGGTTNFTFTSSDAPNCQATTSNITVTGLPVVYGVTGGGTYCLGSSSVVGLSGSQTGVNYQLVLNGSTNVGSPVAGTGSAISFGGQTQVGTYTVVATTTTNSCVSNMSGNAVVNMLQPNVNNTTPTSIGTNGGTMNGTD